MPTGNGTGGLLGVPAADISSSSAPSSLLLESPRERAEREEALIQRFGEVFCRTTLPSQRRDAREKWARRHLPSESQLRSDGVNGQIGTVDDDDEDEQDATEARRHGKVMARSGLLRSLYWKLYFCHLPLAKSDDQGHPLSPPAAVPSSSAGAGFSALSPPPLPPRCSPLTDSSDDSDLDEADPSQDGSSTLPPSAGASLSWRGTNLAALSRWQQTWLRTVDREREHYEQLRHELMRKPNDKRRQPTLAAAGEEGNNGWASGQQQPEGDGEDGSSSAGRSDVGLQPRTALPTSLPTGSKPDEGGSHFAAQQQAQRQSLTVPGQGAGDASRSARTGSEDLTINNPLSLASANPWTRHFRSLELLTTIEADVRRTFPDIALFSPQNSEDDVEIAPGHGSAAGREGEEAEYRAAVLKSLTNILFVWSCLHPDVGYRQGMHELAATCYFARWQDRMRVPQQRRPNTTATATAFTARSGRWLGGLGLGGSGKPPTPTVEEKDAASEELLRILLDESHIEHDTYTLFNSLMLGAKPWYEWQSRPRATGGLSAEEAARRGSLPAPIITKCGRVFSLLKRIDPALASHLSDTLRIEPQLWALKWIRLMFTREFPLDEALVLWDGVLAYDGLAAGMRKAAADEDGAGDDRFSHRGSVNSTAGGEDLQAQGQGYAFVLVDYICIAMLLRIRARLLAASYSGALQLLLRYPSLQQRQRVDGEADSDDGGAEAEEDEEDKKRSRQMCRSVSTRYQQRTDLLIRQAILLHTSPTPATGVQVVIQNRDLLGVDMVVDKVGSSSSSSSVDGGAAAMTAGRAAASRLGGSGAVRASTIAGRASTQQRPAFGSDTFAGRPGAPASAFSPTAYLPGGVGDLARGLYERSETLGINRAVGSAVSHVANRAGAYAVAAVAGRPSSSGPPDASGFPPMPQGVVKDFRKMSRIGPHNEMPDHVPLSSGDANADLQALTASNRAMGEAVGTCVAALEKRFKNEPASAALSEDDLAALMALTALKHIRDVLSGTTREFNVDILGPRGAPDVSASTLASESGTGVRSSMEASSSSLPGLVRTRTDRGSTPGDSTAQTSYTNEAPRRSQDSGTDAPPLTPAELYDAEPPAWGGALPPLWSPGLYDDVPTPSTGLPRIAFKSPPASASPSPAKRPVPLPPVAAGTAAAAAAPASEPVVDDPLMTAQSGATSWISANSAASALGFMQEREGTPRPSLATSDPLGAM